MLDLAINGGKKPVSLADISGRQEISLSYLEQLFAKLRRKQLVTSARGPGGGYRLARSGNDIFVAQIIDAVAESVDVTNCQGKGNCHHGETCLTHHLWEDLSGQIHDFLSQISLGDLMEGRGQRVNKQHTDGVLQTLSLQ
jgi:Rrf2 family iron-sulfur cluster assembly transcriptional regulator